MDTNPLDRDEFVAVANTINEIYNPPDKPRVLYHYTSFDGLEGITRSNTIRATYNRSLNDETEQKYAVKIIGSALRELAQAKLHLPIDITRAIVRPKQFIASFCESGDVSAMWNLYAGGGNGCCLEFDYRGLDNVALPDLPLNIPWPLLSKVSYGAMPLSIERHLVALRDGLKPDGSNVASSASHLWLFIAGLIKERKWQHEREWRIIAVDPPDERVVFPQTEGPVPKPFVELSWLHWGRSKERLPITRVIYDPAYDQHRPVALRIRSILSGNGYADVPVESFRRPLNRR